MTPIQRLLFVLSLSVGPGFGLCRGQEDFHPQVSVVHPGPDAMIKDLKSVFDLTPANEPYWLDVKDLLENMALGVDPERPIRIDVLTGMSPVNYTFWVPFDEFDFLRESMDSLAYETIPEAGEKGLYRIVELEDVGWLREIDAGKYAAMILTTPETGESLKLFIQKLKNPSGDLQALIDRKAGLAVRIANRLQDSESIKKRVASLEKTMAGELDALERRPSETRTEFELRRGTFESSLEELNRVLADADVIEIWGNIAPNAEYAEVEFEATGITDSSLGQLIDSIGKTPDLYASIKPLDESVLSGRMNYPVDELRRKNVNRFLDLITADIESRVAASSKLNETEKSATREMIAGITQVVRDGAATGNANGFVEATHNGTEFTMVGAIAAPDAARLTESVRKLGEARAGNAVELDIATVGDFKVHKIVLAEGFIQAIDDIFGAGREFYVAISDTQAWFSTGPGAQELLTQQIEGLGEPAVSDTALSIDAKMYPWVNRLYELAEQREMPAAVEKRSAWREDLQLMKQLAESLEGDDDFSAIMNSSENRLNGKATFGKGLLRFVGRRVARFSREQLGG